MPRRRDPSDLTDARSAILASLVPAPKAGGRPARHDRRVSKDDEVLPATEGAWIYRAMTHLMLARLARRGFSRHPLDGPRDAGS